MKLIRYLILLCLPCLTFANQKVVNVYAWTGEIPEFVVQQFEAETGIKVNFSTFESNEILYAKLRATKNPGYDVIMPSSYFVNRMHRLNILDKLDKTKLPNLKNLSPAFLHPSYDPNSEVSVPFIWGITGIFVNTKDFEANTIKKWSDLWQDRFQNQLMLLDDSREVFSMALLSLGYPANDSNPEHIKQAFLHLKKLMKNIKVFSTETVVSIIIDEDATIGMAWNGDTFKAHATNKNIQFIFPADGFVIWVDNFAIPTSAPHKDAAYQFINFILRPDVAKNIALATHFPTTNAKAHALLPDTIKNNTSIYPPDAIMKKRPISN